MKRINKGSEPSLLAQYKTKNPDGTWENCKRNTLRRDQIQQQLRIDQGGLCAYCEIDLKPADTSGAADFRVEHFHPKSDTSPVHNWHLDWDNLLGCCHGGSRSDVVDATQRSSPDHSCDVPKKGKDLSAVILNPMHIPATPVIFNCERATGSLSVNKQSGIDIEKAQHTIDELNLDGSRLRRLRKAELDKINDALCSMTVSGTDPRQARDKIAKAVMRKNADGNWPKFFSSLRGYLGKSAEDQLQRINYTG